MADETNLTPDPGAAELTTPEGTGDVSNTGNASPEPGITLKQLSVLAGREFANTEDFNKHYGNLKSFVGKKVESTPTASSSQVDTDLFVTRDELARRDWKIEHPEAKDLADDIFTIAALEDKTPDEVYQNRYKPLVEAKLLREQAEAKEKELGTSASRLSPQSSQELDALVKQYKSVPSGSPQGSKEIEAAIVAKVLPNFVK